LFGNIEVGDFVRGNDRYPCAIIHSINEKMYIEEDEIEDFMVINKHDGYLVPSEWKFEVFYSKSFMKELSI
jgi:hypothetical protein